MGDESKSKIIILIFYHITIVVSLQYNFRYQRFLQDVLHLYVSIAY
jgi:hypothetical protein